MVEGGVCTVFDHIETMEDGHREWKRVDLIVNNAFNSSTESVLNLLIFA